MSGYKVVCYGSGSESEIFATETEAEQDRLDQINEHLSEHVWHLLNDMEHGNLSPAAAEDIVQRKGLEELVIVEVEDKRDEE